VICTNFSFRKHKYETTDAFGQIRKEKEEKRRTAVNATNEDENSPLIHEDKNLNSSSSV
jgi:hypothetical protein